MKGSFLDQHKGMMQKTNFPGLKIGLGLVGFGLLLMGLVFMFGG